MPGSYVDLDWLHYPVTEQTFPHLRTSIRSQGEGRFVLCPYKVWHGLSSGGFFPWEFPIPRVSAAVGAAHPSCGAVCAPSLAGTRGKSRIGLRPWDAAEPPGCHRAGGFLRGSLKILHLRAFPARRRNDSFWASPPGRCSDTDEWVR